MIRLWIREDGQQPKALALVGGIPPGPGKVVDVDTKTSDEARRIYATTLQPEPAEESDPDGWLEWRRCQRLVKEIAPAK